MLWYSIFNFVECKYRSWRIQVSSENDDHLINQKIDVGWCLDLGVNFSPLDVQMLIRRIKYELIIKFTDRD